MSYMEYHELKQEQERNHAKPMTNADRIRAMSDGELTSAIFCNVECCCCPASEICKAEKGSCTDRIMKWLKQPAEVG